MALELSPQEEYIVNVLRELKPFEVITIHKDKQGVPDSYLLQRSQKIIVSQVMLDTRNRDSII